MKMTYEHEKDVLKDVITWLSMQRDLEVIRVVDRYTSGYSDLFICVKGFMVLVELKDATGIYSKPQEKFLKRLANVGAFGGVCRNVPEVKFIINQARLEAEKLYGDGEAYRRQPWLSL